MKWFYNITSSISFMLAGLLVFADDISKATFMILVAIHLNMLYQNHEQQDE